MANTHRSGEPGEGREFKSGQGKVTEGVFQGRLNLGGNDAKCVIEKVGESKTFGSTFTAVEYALQASSALDIND